MKRKSSAAYRRNSLVAASVALCTLGAAGALAAQSTSLTVYNDGRVLVRRSVPLTIPKGASEQRATLGALDPATVFALDSGVTIVGASYDGAVDEASTLRRALGHKIVFRTSPTDTVSATVVGVDPERYRLADGRVIFGRPGQLVFPEDVVVTEPALRLALRSDTPRKGLRLGYFTTGADWQASYQVMLGRSVARVAGSAVINSQALRAEDAEVQLLAGAVGRAESPRTKLMGVIARADRMEAAAPSGEAGEQRVGEFHLYTLPGRSTLLPGTATSVALFEPASAAFEKAYVVPGSLPYWGMLPQQGDQGEVPVRVSYTLRRPRKTDFGDRPLPGGVARLYEADSSGRAQLVGEASLGHTAPGQDLRLSAGDAFDLTARRIQTAYSTRRDTTKVGGVRMVATADYTVTLANATDAAVTIEVREERAGEWSVVSSSLPAEKISSTMTRFRVPVPARGQATLNYRVRAVW